MTEKRPPSSATRKVRECPPRTFPKVHVRGTIPPGRGLIPPSQGLGLGLGLRLGLGFKFKVRVRVMVRVRVRVRVVRDKFNLDKLKFISSSKLVLF